MDLLKQVKIEKERADFAFKEIKVKNTEKAKELFELAYSYYKDANYFYSKGQFLEAFELFAYVWGLLDAGARLGLFDPGKARRHYKIDQIY